MQKLASYLIPIALVLMGLGLMATGSLARKASIPEWLFLLVAFAVFNLAVAYASGFWPNLAAAWSPSKSPFAVIGFALGLLPTGIAILFAYLSHDTFSIDMGKLTVSSALITLAIVSWEELWFRGIALEWGVCCPGSCDRVRVII